MYEGSFLHAVASISQAHLRLYGYLMEEAVIVALAGIALLALMLALVIAAILVWWGTRLGLLWFSDKFLCPYRSPGYALKALPSDLQRILAVNHAPLLDRRPPLPDLLLPN
jgi:hypothetical protein